MHVGSQYFLVRIPKDEQKYKREHLGNFFLHPNLVFFTKNTQCGEILDIGFLAKRSFPTAKVGDIVIMHHFVEGSLDKRNTRTSQVMEDDTYKYYVVCAVELPGTRVQSYAVWNGKEIIPHNDYIFLERDLHKKTVPVNNNFIQPEYIQSAERTLSELKKIKATNLSLSKNKRNADITEAIQKKDRMREQITSDFHKKQYQKYTVAFSSDSAMTDFVYSLNIASNTLIEFLGKEYRVVEKKHLAMLTTM